MTAGPIRVSGAVVLAVLALLAAPAARGAQPPAQPFAAQIELSGTIDPATAAWIEDALADARADGARLAIVRLDTPGGLDSAMRDIVRALLRTPLPVVVHVAPDGARAASAGLFVTQAADVAAMAPGTNIGAATPVSAGGGNLGEDLGRKIENDAAAYVRALAERHGRNPRLAEEMVREATSVTAARALAAGLVDVLAADSRALLTELDGFVVQGPKARTLATAGLAVDARPMPWHVELRQLLVSPTIAFLLLLGGLLLLGLEFASPGLVGPGLFGAIALVLGLYGTAQLPVTASGIALLLLGAGLVIVETQTGTGLAGAAAVVALVAGGLLLYDTDSEVFAVSVPAAIAAGVVLGAIVVVAAGKAVSARRLPPRGDLATELVGCAAEVRSPLDPAGQVYVQGALWRAVAVAGAPVPAGVRVVVESVEDLTLKVRPPSEESP